MEASTNNTHPKQVVNLVDLDPRVIAMMTKTELKEAYRTHFDTDEELEAHIDRLLDKEAKRRKKEKVDKHAYKEATLRYFSEHEELILQAKKREKKHAWSDEEVEFLKQNWKYLSDNTIALALNISVGTVGSKRRKLGLYKYKDTKHTAWQYCPHMIWHDRANYAKDKATLMEHAELPLYMNISQQYSPVDLSVATLHERPPVDMEDIDNPTLEVDI